MENFIEEKDWTLFIEMLVLCFGLFVLDVFSNIGSLLILFVGVFFVMHINNKEVLKSYFADKINTYRIRSMLIDDLNQKRWNLWFISLIGIGFLRMLAMANVLYFSQTEAIILAIACSLYIFQVEFLKIISQFIETISFDFKVDVPAWDSFYSLHFKFSKFATASFSMVTECDLSYIVHRGKILLSSILMIVFLRGIASKGHFSLFTIIGIVFLIFCVLIYAKIGLYSNYSKSKNEVFYAYKINFGSSNKSNNISEVFFCFFGKFTKNIAEVAKNVLSFSSAS